MDADKSNSSSLFSICVHLRSSAANWFSVFFISLLESDLVFTTIGQLLSGYIFLPVSLPNRLGNMNAGALIGSLLVFDELHLFDPDVALGTIIEMLNRLQGLCQFVLMTATMSDDAIGWIATNLRATASQIPDTEIRSLPTQQTKRRMWRYCDRPITAERSAWSTEAVELSFC